MSFTDQKPFVVDDVKLNGFTRHRKSFLCSLCGHSFKIGDTARWVYANDGLCGFHGGNFFVCDKCDQGSRSEIIEKAKISFDSAKQLARQWGVYGPDSKTW